MRWLLDQGIPRSAADRLEELSEEAIHVGDVGMAQASDAAIIERAIRENRVIITLDADFHALIALTGAGKPSVIRIREEGLKGRAITALVIQIARGFGPDLEAGCLVTYSRGKVRLRALPLS